METWEVRTFSSQWTFRKKGKGEMVSIYSDHKNPICSILPLDIKYTSAKIYI